MPVAGILRLLDRMNAKAQINKSHHDGPDGTEEFVCLFIRQIKRSNMRCEFSRVEGQNIFVLEDDFNSSVSDKITLGVLFPVEVISTAFIYTSCASTLFSACSIVKNIT